MSNSKNSLTRVQRPSPLMDPEAFNHIFRVGKLLALSPLFPEHLRKGKPDEAAANGALVMNMAHRLNEDPLTVAQNIYFVGGKPGWSASYMISKANQHQVFENPIAWEYEGEGDDLVVTAYGIMASTGKRVEATASMAMAKAEGWTKNTKYESMPKQMLSYRSATSLIRLYCPEVMVGIPSTIEIDGGMKDVTPDDSFHIEPTLKKAAKNVEEAETIGDEGEAKEEEKADAPVVNEADEPEAEEEKAEDKPISEDEIEWAFGAVEADLTSSPEAKDEILKFHKGGHLALLKKHAPEKYKSLMEWPVPESEAAE
ncbi:MULTISPECIES: hypothetical protein [Halocynthiibacter]|uniref:Recombinase RecT n=1 Tax=Halocynthiibacter halioticoli TaxID=2986804 RepID=A0AAE3J1J1_9RHOB|nr:MULTISPECIES: hypothetical protein [Halocynthiibacter]MCV6826030.1 hypothetical protein [Halocynthiibacter halioticoli]MCW4059031.1 hypothetical protein [Halocynthiibacter sp. SDUM655004]